ncbi:uncharacterized protein C8Q71DRAFT_775177 [Rhodofomes roseus]|uniref:Zn(2)-C6 fungal-type domain-containing protein n=1 Tax=Rhodofomes roseus TaxID=34475 RepID=A0ABQ8K7C3_9APHY|nr:uncharacterized protein C8Q71DRAFT_775177 [Rhodofomes roseus]KAH9832829.1 hypothetical protein C8Q71DRAFT_775177 [Rhodofomes roseus]
MVGTWTEKHTQKYFRAAVKKHVDFIGTRKHLEFTDQVPPTHEWTAELLEQFNRNLRGVYNGPFDWETTEVLLMKYIMTDDLLNSLKNLSKDVALPHLVRLVLDWACWDPPEEGAWPPGLSMRRYFMKWRHCEPLNFKSDTSTDVDMEQAANALLDMWIANDRLYADTPVQYREAEDVPGVMQYKLRMQDVTDEQRREAAEALEAYLNQEWRCGAPLQMKAWIKVRSYKRPENLPPAENDTVIRGPYMCIQCVKACILECRVPNDTELPKCVSCRVRKIKCAYQTELVDPRADPAFFNPPRALSKASVSQGSSAGPSSSAGASGSAKRTADTLSEEEREVKHTRS